MLTTNFDVIYYCPFRIIASDCQSMERDKIFGMFLTSCLPPNMLIDMIISYMNIAQNCFTKAPASRRKNND